MTAANDLLKTHPLLNINGLPEFSKVLPEQIVPALTHILAENRAHIAQLLNTVQVYTWENFVEPLNELNDRLNRSWSVIGHLHNVVDSPALRTAYNACLPLLSAYRSEIGQNYGLFTGYQAIANSPDYAQLTVAQQQVIQNELRDFRLGGVDLPAEKQNRYREIQQALAKLTTRFGENLLDATHGWKKHITAEKLLSGLPESTRNLTKQNAEQAQLDGWLFTLEAPCYLPTLNYADNRELRQEMYSAYVTRASDQGPNAGQWDNSAIMLEILALRHELANLLGFCDYTGYSLATKMAKTPEQVLGFLLDLAQRARPVAERDLAELQAFAHEHYGISHLEMWDVPYYSEKLREHRYAISQEMLRPYFALPAVLTGLFQIVQRLYGLSIHKQEGVDVWHPDVQFFVIYDNQGELRGQFYLDAYARPGKRSGAWMDECIMRKRTSQGVQIPVAHLACNFTPPLGQQPSLLTHTDVITLFHEFGHGLHHLLTKVDYLPVSGINGVPWDAVELPSQFMENWCWEWAALDLFAHHYATGAALPSELFDKLLAAKNFQAGLFMLRQLEFAVFDFRLHKEYQPGIDIQGLLDDVRRQVAVLIPPAFNRFQHSFSHIFSGSYAAGYYSYKWAEVLAADAFSKFTEMGIFNPQTGLEFLHAILEKGGSQDPMQLFREFRGREPTIEALLRHTGICT